MTDADFIACASRAVIGAAASERSNEPPHQVALTVCAACKRGWQETGSKSVELAPADIERMRCDAVELGRVDGELPDDRVRSIPAPIRRAVLARDHDRCTVPGCRSATYVDVHHIKYRSRGGNNTMPNLTTLCSLHHDLVHYGRILISGTAGNLTITHSGGRPYGTPPPEPPRSSAASHADRATRPPAARMDHTASPPAAHAGRVASPRSAIAADARSVLTGLGYRPIEAAAAVERAMTHEAEDVTLETLIRAALRQCPRPPSA